MLSRRPSCSPVRHRPRLPTRSCSASGTTQDLDSLNPYSTILVVGYEAFGLTYNYMIDSARTSSRSRASPTSGSGRPTVISWTFHIRDGMKWSDGEPATSADACFSWQLGVDAIKNEASLGAGYLEPYDVGRGRDRGQRARTPSTLIATTDDPSDRVLQIALPIIPKHIWGKETYKTIGKAKFEPPLVGTGPYQTVDWQTGQFIRLQRNPNYWGTQGVRGRGRHRHLQDRRHHGPGAQGGRARLRAQPQRRPAQRAEDRSEHEDRRRQRQRLDPARLQRVWRRHTARPSRTAGRRPRRSSTRRSATPSATPSTTGARRQGPRRLWRRRHDDRPAGPDDVARRAGPSADLRHRDWPSRSSTRCGLRARLRTGNGSTRKASRSACGCSCPIRAPIIQRPPSSSRTGTASSGSRSRPRSSGRPRWASRSCRRRPVTSTRPSTTSSCGDGAVASIPTACSRSSGARRSARRPTASTATRPTTRCTPTS